MTKTVTVLTDADREHRAAFRAFVLSQAELWHREHLGRLYELWEEWNTTFFDGRLVPPYILLTPPESARAYGDCGRISSFGGRSQIRIRSSLLTGTHAHSARGAEYTAGRFLLVADILLHEAIHQWHFEVTGDIEESYHCHGPAFAAMCNKIGAALGLPPVRSMKKRGKDRGLPSCAHWPHNVRPADYYQGAYLHGQAKANQRQWDTGQTTTINTGPLTPAEWQRLIDAARDLAIGALIERLAAYHGVPVTHR